MRRREAGISVKYRNSAVINLFIPSWGVLKYQCGELELEQYAQRFLRKLVRGLERREGMDGVECVYLGEGVFCCFLDMSEMYRDSRMKQRLTSVATVCFRCCKDEEYAFGVGVSNICFGDEGIRQAYQQAREMIKLGFYKDAGILYYEDSPSIGKVLPREAQELSERAEDYVKRRQYENMEEGFRKVTEVFRQQHTDPRLVLHWLRALDEQLKAERKPEEYAAVTKAEQLMEICEGYRSRLFLEQRKPISGNVGAAVRRVAEYLHVHYKEQIGLSDAAEMAGLNPAYLSFLFKQEMGIGFASYLLELRMECAKALLRGTNDKVKEVARQAGFNDYHYFSKTFKKINGCSPVDYRKENTRI